MSRSCVKSYNLDLWNNIESTCYSGESIFPIIKLYQHKHLSLMAQGSSTLTPSLIFTARRLTDALLVFFSSYVISNNWSTPFSTVFGCLWSWYWPTLCFTAPGQAGIWTSKINFHRSQRDGRLNIVQFPTHSTVPRLEVIAQKTLN